MVCMSWCVEWRGKRLWLERGCETLRYTRQTPIQPHFPSSTRHNIDNLICILLIVLISSLVVVWFGMSEWISPYTLLSCYFLLSCCGMCGAVVAVLTVCKTVQRKTMQRTKNLTCLPQYVDMVGEAAVLLIERVCLSLLVP